MPISTHSPILKREHSAKQLCLKQCHVTKVSEGGWIVPAYAPNIRSVKIYEAQKRMIVL